MATITPPPTHTAPAVPVPRVLGVLILRTALLFAAIAGIFGIGRIVDPHSAWSDRLIWTNVAIVAVDVVTIAVVAQLVRREGGRLRDLIRFRVLDLAWGLVALLILTVAFLMATFIGNLIAYGGPPPTYDHVPHIPLWLGLWSLLVMPVTVAIAEEACYRGYAQPRLTAHWGRWLAWVAVAVAFGLQHIPLSFTSPHDALARFITTALVGLVFGALLWWFKRLGPIIVGHWLIDVIGLGLPMMMGALS